MDKDKFINEYDKLLYSTLVNFEELGKQKERQVWSIKLIILYTVLAIICSLYHERWNTVAFAILGMIDIGNYFMIQKKIDAIVKNINDDTKMFSDIEKE